MKDMINHPPHYASGKIEVIEAIEDWGLNFSRGNAVKYVARAGKKDPAREREDLEKAAWYINREIELLKAKSEDRQVTRPNDMNSRVHTCKCGHDLLTAHNSDGCVVPNCHCGHFLGERSDAV